MKSLIKWLCFFYFNFHENTTGLLFYDKDFIDEWLATQKGEWGYFGIKSKNGATFGSPNCEYEYGRITTEPLPSEFLNKKIKGIYGSGGWSRSDFQFEIEGEENK